MNEKWTKKYKKSIDCSNPKGFSQKAHCAGRKKRQQGKTTMSKSVNEQLLKEVELFLEENVPTNPSKWSYYKSQAKKKFDVYPSAYANAWAAKMYKKAGGGWRTKKESIDEFQRDRQLRNPSKEMLVVKNGKVQVIDKKDWKKYKSKGYIVAENGRKIVEASLSVIHRAAKKGSYPVTVMAIDKKKRKVVKQELVKTPMAVPAAFTMMQGAYPEASISVEDATGQILFSESVNEAATRRSEDFFDEYKHGREIRKMLKGTWNTSKVKKYIDTVGGSDIKWARIMDDMANRIGLDHRRYNNRPMKDMVNDILDKMEKLYSIHMSESVNEGKITKTFKFPRKTSTDMDEIDADFSRQGIKSNPDFNNNTITVTGDENKIKKIVKFHRGIEESVVNEAKSVTLITYGGREIKYKNSDIDNFIRNLDLNAEDLPGLLYRASMNNPNIINTRAKSYDKKKEAILKLLKKIKSHSGDVIIDLDSKKPSFKHTVRFGLPESVNERYRPNLDSKGWDAAQKVIRQLQSSVFRKLDDDELLEFRKAIADAFNLDGILK